MEEFTKLVKNEDDGIGLYLNILKLQKLFFPKELYCLTLGNFLQFKAFSNCFYFLRDKFSTRNLVSQVSLKLTYLRKNLQWVLRTTIILS